MTLALAKPTLPVLAQQPIELVMPYPPSVNHYWQRSRNGGMHVSEIGVRFRNEVWGTVLVMRGRGELPREPLCGALRATIYAVPPDGRVRDLDNIQKALFDALTHARVWLDDSQVCDQRVVRRPSTHGGRIRMLIESIADPSEYGWPPTKPPKRTSTVGRNRPIAQEAT